MIDRDELRQIIDPLSAYPWTAAPQKIRPPKGRRAHRRLRRSLRQMLRNISPRIGPAGSMKWNIS